ncbi:MAG TPA: alpha/beta hydrolase [Acidimicrobiales bacterium]
MALTLERELVLGNRDLAPLVFLHEGLGSLSLWRRFPREVAAATGWPTTLVYSRPGYGRSAPVPLPRPVTYMHDEALETLPALLGDVGIERPVLVGHSDGASIAIIHAGAGFDVAALVLIAPHVFVEERSIEGIRASRAAYDGGDLRARLAHHHANVDVAFRGWSDVWLSPAFRSWTITSSLPPISCPVLLIQAEDDPYGTAAQLDAIEEGVAGPVERVELPGSTHSPHVDHPEIVVNAIAGFLVRDGR